MLLQCPAAGLLSNHNLASVPGHRPEDKACLIISYGGDLHTHRAAPRAVSGGDWP